MNKLNIPQNFNTKAVIQRRQRWVAIKVMVAAAASLYALLWLIK